MGLKPQIRQLTATPPENRLPYEAPVKTEAVPPYFSKILNTTHCIGRSPWIYFVDPQHKRHHDQQGRPVLGLLFQEVAVAGLRLGPGPFSAQVSNVLQSQDRSASSLTVRFTC